MTLAETKKKIGKMGLRSENWPAETNISRKQNHNEKIQNYHKRKPNTSKRTKHKHQ